MKDLYYRLLAITVCFMCAMSVLATDTAFAQEGEDDDPKAEETTAESGAEGEEGDEDAALAAARRRFGPNKSTAAVGEKEIFLIGPKLAIDEDPDYPKVAELKDGAIVVMTLGQAIKLSTQFDLKFGDLLVKNANFHPEYPGVYSLWLKKQGDGWRLVFNEKPDVWGTMHKDEHDVGETDIHYFKLGEPEEGVKFDVYADETGGTLTIRWGMHEWKAPFTIQQ